MLYTCNQGRPEQFSLVLLWILVEAYAFPVKKAFTETDDLEQALRLPYQSEKLCFALVMVAAGTGTSSHYICVESWHISISASCDEVSLAVERMCWFGLTHKGWTMTAVNWGDEPKCVWLPDVFWAIIHWVTLECISHGRKDSLL